MQEDVTLHDAEIPDAMAARFGGPNVGIAGLRAKCGAGARAFTCAALKPQGLPPRELASLAGRLAAGGIDFIKDDHGIADQAYSPFADRVRACAEAIRQAGVRHALCPQHFRQPRRCRRADRARHDGGHRGGYGRAHDNRRLELPPARARVPEYGVLRPPRHGGRVADRATAPARQAVPPFRRGRHHLPELWRALQLLARNLSRAVADAARRDWCGLRPCLPCPAGGMTLDRVPEILDFYGPDTMLLIGGSLLSASDRLSRSNGRIRRARCALCRGSEPMDDGGRSGRRLTAFDGRASNCSPIRRKAARPFKAITRQVLFQRPELQCELRYFEMQPGGHSTLERHEHVHAVMIFRGRGTCLVGDEVREVAAPDLCFHPSDDLAPIPREQGRAVRLSVHGECRAGQAAASNRCAVTGAEKEQSDRRFSGGLGNARPGLSSQSAPLADQRIAAAGTEPRFETNWLFVCTLRKAPSLFSDCALVCVHIVQSRSRKSALTTVNGAKSLNLH